MDSDSNNEEIVDNNSSDIEEEPKKESSKDNMPDTKSQYLNDIKNKTNKKEEEILTTTKKIFEGYNKTRPFKKDVGSTKKNRHGRSTILIPNPKKVNKETNLNQFENIIDQNEGYNNSYIPGLFHTTGGFPQFPRQREQTIKKKINEDNSFKDLSHIDKKEKFNYYEIEKSIFGDNLEDEFKEFNQEDRISDEMNKDKDSVSNEKNCEEDKKTKELSQYYYNRILNAEVNEEIELPDVTLKMSFINISKPIKIKGQVGSTIEITEGPIVINIAEQYETDYVKISQVRIVLNDSKMERELLENQHKKGTYNLFTLNPGSLLELEDCDIIFEEKKNSINKNITNVNFNINNQIVKRVAFLLYPCKRVNDSENAATTVLNITNSRIFGFYQSIRWGINCIVNVNKSAISQNYGNSIVLINPLIVKINETLFERNLKSVIHLKFNDDESNNFSRLFLFQKNTFEMNMGSAISIEGESKKLFKLSITMIGNTFKYNQCDGVIIRDITYITFEIYHNNFIKNKGNGFNLQKVFPYNYDFESENEINNLENNNDNTKNKKQINVLSNTNINPHNKNTQSNYSIKINDNQFIENEGFGLFVNYSRIEAEGNDFKTNRASGMILCNLILDNSSQKTLDHLKSDNYISKYSTNASSQFLKFNEKNKSILKQNKFEENGESGLKVINYYYVIYMEKNIFKENCDHGLLIDLDCGRTDNSKTHNLSAPIQERIKLFKESNNTVAKSYANMIINKCIIEKNIKSGISMANSFIYCSDSFINDNLEYAIHISIKEYKYAFRESNIKNHKNIIHGSLGGDWGEISLEEKTFCQSNCFGGNRYQKSKKDSIINDLEKRNDNNELFNRDDDIENYVKDKSNNKPKNNAAKKKRKNNSDNGCIIY